MALVPRPQAPPPPALKSLRDQFCTLRGSEEAGLPVLARFLASLATRVGWSKESAQCGRDDEDKNAGSECPPRPLGPASFRLRLRRHAMGFVLADPYSSAR